MKSRLRYRKARGQSAVFIAMLIVVLLAMVGLAVDVGNTYAEQRATVRATNAASIAAVDKIISGGSDPNVAQAIKGSFASNGIMIQNDPSVPLQPGERRVKAIYLDVNGNPIGGGCQVGFCSTSSVPEGAWMVQIDVDGTVDTYFARVVGTNTLPVKAQAFAARCLPTKNVFPIAVAASDLTDANGGGFLPPSDPAQLKYYGVYKDSDYRTGKSQRRIYLKDNFDAPGSFSWLAWKPDSSYTNENGLQQMLERDGNLFKGFQEVTPWPDDKEQAPTVNGKVVYPQRPGQMDATDWVYGNKGLSWSQDVKAALQFHIDNRTKMNLPIISKVVKSSTNAFKLARVGTFYLRGFSDQGGDNAYLDLVYLGNASEEACLQTNMEEVRLPGIPSAPGVLDSLGITGNVWVYPRWGEPVEVDQPVAFIFILDASGSMSWNFNGEGTYGGVDYNCESQDGPSSLPYRSTCTGGPTDPWRTVEERRIAVARNAMKQFVARMKPTDTLRVVAFSTENVTGGPVRWTTVAPNTWTTDKPTLTSAVDTIASLNDDKYRTRGGTPGANGVASALALLQASDMPKTAPDGKEYKKVVIYLTDGVANQFYPNGPRNDARDICGHMPTTEAQNTPYCQIGVMANGTERPITAMISQAQKIKDFDPSIAVYSIALGPVDATGLDRVANGPDYSFQATNAGAVQDILSRIYKQVVTGCVAASGKPINVIPSENMPDLTNYPDLQSKANTYGFVYLYDQAGNALPDGKNQLPITINNGQLNFTLPAEQGLKPGTYQLKAYVAYKGKDKVTRTYASIIDPMTLKRSASMSFVISPSNTLGKIVSINPVFLDLDPSIKVCQ